MFNFYKTSLSLIFSLLAISLLAQTFTFDNNWSDEGIKLTKESNTGIEIIYSVHEFNMDAVSVKGTEMKAIHLPANMIPNNEGSPDLSGRGQYIAIPQGATAKLNVISYRTEKYENVEVAPAPRIPLDTDNSPLQYNKDESIYSVDAFYPENPFILSENTSIRGVDAVLLGITPFQYNPVSKELIVYLDVELEISFEGGNGQFGETRYRSRWFDPILSDHFLNFSSLPEIDYSSKGGSKSDGFEYVIISPDDPVFLAWADTLRIFRQMQGISTGIYTISDIGGNNINTIEDFINDAYDTWSIPPLAFLILADYGATGNGILSPIWDYYCASDHIYGDVNGNGMADVVMARMTATNETHLQNMITKITDFETNPPTYESFYNPITALGWQTERWFQICSETIGGYFKNVQGKNPIRINEIYGGNPDVDPWSTATNTNTIMNVFGPNGLGYIPSNPSDLGNWADGNASMINTAINNGAFIIQHRDHGGNTGWGEPAYNNNSLNGLSNEDPIFVFSINCLTGKYNWSGECFTEKFHRMEQGALGLIAASEVSYSFVNDTYVWGLYDYMFPDFLPQFGSTIAEERGMLPAFANVAAKYFLKTSTWPYNEGNKEVTYHLFHHHGCAFQTLYSEVPMDMIVLHDNVLLTGETSFTVTADSGAFVAISFEGEILGTAESDGTAINFTITALQPNDIIDVIATKPNYFRYHGSVLVIPGDFPYVVFNDYVINDAAGNNDGVLDYGESLLLSLGLENVGLVDAIGVSADINTDNIHTMITENTAIFGDIDAQSIVSVTDEYALDVANDISDGDVVTFNIEATDGNSSWSSMFAIEAHAPDMQYIGYSLDDSAGNGNGKLDPGETAIVTIDIANLGSSEAYNVSIALSCSGKGFVNVTSGPQTIGDMPGGSNSSAVFTVYAEDYTPGGFIGFFNVNINADKDISGAGGFDIIVGQFAALILDLDPNNYSGPVMLEAFNDLDLIASYSTVWPEDLSDYKSLFIPLGIIFAGHELTALESTKLVQFLYGGGRLYLEGRRTWHDDPQQPIHNKFNIDVVLDDWFQYDTLVGVHSTFTDGMTFTYDGVTPLNDYYMTPEDNAFTIITGMNPDFAHAVAYDEGTYKTIGCSFEFGSLVDGTHPSTRAQIMYEYLNFFGDIVTSVPDAHVPDATASIDNMYPNPFNDQTTISFSIDEDMDVAIDIYSIDGRKVASLVDRNMKAGEHSMNWDGTDLNGNAMNKGIYLCTLRTNSVITTKKLIRY